VQAVLNRDVWREITKLPVSVTAEVPVFNLPSCTASSSGKECEAGDTARKKGTGRKTLSGY